MKRLLLIILLFPLFSREYIAIIDFEAIGVSESDAKALTQRLTSEMIEIGEYQIVERSEMKRLMEEQKFQYSGCVDIKCAVDIGKMIGAKYMAVGSVSKVGSTYSIDSRMISVETGESYISASFNYRGEIDYLLIDGMKSIAYQLCDLKYLSDNENLYPKKDNSKFNNQLTDDNIYISKNQLMKIETIFKNYKFEEEVKQSFITNHYNIYSLEELNSSQTKEIIYASEHSISLSNHRIISIQNLLIQNDNQEKLILFLKRINKKAVREMTQLDGDFLIHYLQKI